MLTSSSRPRHGHILLWVSATLFVLFAGLAFAIWSATHTRFEADPNLLEGLKTAEFIEESASSADAGWPQWRGPHRDGVIQMPNLLTEWPAGGPKILWEKDIAANGGYSSFAVASGRAYTLVRDGTEEAIVCWNLDDGSERWRKSYPSGLSKNASLGGYGLGPRSTPTLYDGFLYTVGAGGVFQCRKAESASLIWEKHLLGEYAAPNLQWGTAFSPLVDGTMVYTNPGGPGGKSLVAFDRITGKEQWRSQDDPAGYSSPLAITVDGERQIVFFTGIGLVGVTARDGTLRWRFPWTTDHGINAATPIAFRAKIGTHEQQFVFISSGYGKGCALVSVRRNGTNFEVLPVFTSNTLCSHFGSPVRVGDCVYGFNESKLICLSLRTGKVRWQKNGFQKGTLLAVNGYLLILGEEGKLALMKATDEAPEVIVEAGNVMGRRRCWTMPVLADGRLLLRDEDKVRCLDLRAR